MSSSESPGEQSDANLSPSAQEFLSYCKLEMERRLNSADEFDQEQFERAVQMVQQRLEALAEEGWE